MRMSITIDESLVKEAMRVFGTSVKREAIEKALREAIRSVRRRKALEHCGSIDLGFDQQDLENLRKQT